MKLALVTSHHPSWNRLCAVTDATKKAYCEKWGIDFHPDESDSRFPDGKSIRGFVKFDCILRHLHNYDAIIWMDADCMVTNDGKPPQPEQTLNPDEQLILGCDFNGLHSTVMFLQNTPLVRDFIYACNTSGRGMFRDHPWHEMESIRYFLQTPPYSSMVRFVTTKKLCPILRSQYPELTTNQVADSYFWEPGDWTLHLGNLSLDKREAIAECFKEFVLK